MNSQNNQHPRTHKPRVIRSLVGGGRYQFKIEVTGWNFKKWGPPPYFGRIWADDEYWAVYEAYDRLNFPVNATFKPKPVRISTD